MQISEKETSLSPDIGNLATKMQQINLGCMVCASAAGKEKRREEDIHSYFGPN